MKERTYYPTHQDVDNWVDAISTWADSIEYYVEILNENGFIPNLGIYHVRNEFTYIKFIPNGMDEFYGYWQPAMSTPAPLLIHLPGYNADISTHPDIVSLGFNVLHIGPLGYTTPKGTDKSKMRNGNWPVFDDTINSNGQQGYKKWIVNCILGIKWAVAQPEVLQKRVSFFGTSQGGAGALLLGSIYKDKGVRCVAADVPFLTNIPLAETLKTDPFPGSLDKIGEIGWRTLGIFDTLSHSHRLNCPVLLTAGGEDKLCPYEAIKSLFDLLPGSKSINYFKNLEHRYSREFISLVSAWFRMYA
jgi:cephalosporin-C deacetylase-like acetyl esterase